MRLHCIAAMAKDRGLGHQGRLLFSLPADLHRFKTLTTGSTVIMGRATLDSLPNGRPLPHRRNIVLTRNQAFRRDGTEVVHSLDELFRILQTADDAWVIGGALVYTQLLPYCHDAYLTEVDAVRPADCYFPTLDKHWTLTSAQPWQICDGVRFRFCVFEKQKLVTLDDI